MDISPRQAVLEIHLTDFIEVRNGVFCGYYLAFPQGLLCPCPLGLSSLFQLDSLNGLHKFPIVTCDATQHNTTHLIIPCAYICSMDAPVGSEALTLTLLVS